MLTSHELNNTIDACDKITDAINILEKQKDKTEKITIVYNLLKAGELILNEEIHKIRQDHFVEFGR